MKAIDFFCGAGGLTRGMLDAGIEVLAGVDDDSRLKQTYEHNNKPSRFIEKDVVDIDIVQLRRELGVVESDTVIYAACTPCQPFSTLNKLKGDDERKYLLLAFAKIVRDSPPDYLIVENVPGLGNQYGRAIYQKFVKALGEAGFEEINFDARKLNAKHYDVPQERERFIMLASRHDKIRLPKGKRGIKTVEDAIGSYPEIEDGEEYAPLLNHVSRKLQPHHKVIVRAVPKNGGSRSDVDDTSILLPCHQKKPDGYKDVFGRMSWKKPAPTITCRCTDVYCGRFTHPDQDRGISLREAAALQTFADDYEFFGSLHQIARQIGNAVPVKFAQALGKAVLCADNQ